MTKRNKFMWAMTMIVTLIIGTGIAHRLREDAASGAPSARSKSHDKKWQNPFSSSSPAYNEADKFLTWLLENKQIDDIIGTGSEIDRFNYASSLESKGLPRLSDELIEKFIPLTGKMIKRLSNADCANLLRGAISPDDLSVQGLRVLESFDEREANSWFLVSRYAIEAQLNSQPIIPFSNELARADVFKIAGSLPTSEAKAFLSNVANLRQANDENLCNTVRALFTGTSLLSEPYQGAVARMLVSGKS